MAERNYLVEGLSGTGKSSVYEELIRRGYKAISTDRAWKWRVDAESEWIWNPQRAVPELERPEPDALFVCGSSANRDRFLPYFTKVFNLRIDDDTMRRRLRERTNNDYGKEPAELELMLALNRSDAKPSGSIDVDATRPLHEVVDELLALADCETVVSDSSLPPWSKRGSVIARSRFLSDSATIAGLEYSWSAHVLEALLAYLAGQGIDLTHAALTSDDREQYLARLDPASFDGALLRRAYEELNDAPSEGVQYAMLDGIAFLRDTLAPLDPGIVAVLSIE
jgi:hypothetical protein